MVACTDTDFPLKRLYLQFITYYDCLKYLPFKIKATSISSVKNGNRF